MFDELQQMEVFPTTVDLKRIETRSPIAPTRLQLQKNSVTYFGTST